MSISRAESTPRPAPRPVCLGIQPSFGFGDRLGSATPGHLAALRQAGRTADGKAIRGIFAQQSIREMARTDRTPEQVMQCAADALAAADYDQPWGADADHLKTPEDVDATADAGFVFYTIDPSGDVDQKADGYDAAMLESRFAAVADDVDWISHYLGHTVTVPEGPTITFDEPTVKRAAVKYGRAIRSALELGQYIKQAAEQRDQPFEIELSVDETDEPTTPAEHYVIADQCNRHGLTLVSLAPRFFGELEKGVDYKGDLGTLEKSLNDHAAIARELGPYKLSLHSGSDKLSMYRLFAHCTRGMFHVKTAGTSYLEALRVVARHDPGSFRDIVRFSRDHYQTDKATYHVSATLDSAPPPDQVDSDVELEKLYLERWEDVSPGVTGVGFTQPGRQILHCTFGSVLTDANLGTLVHQILADHPDTYRDVLATHFTRHLQALGAG